MGYINGGGWFWRWEGTTRVMGSVCVCVCACVLCGRWADTKGYKEMRY